MNVSCPQCKTVFRVDPRKVPSDGVRARCSVCGGVFEVASEEVPAMAAAPGTQAAPEPAISAEPAVAAPPDPFTPPAFQESEAEPALQPPPPPPEPSVAEDMPKPAPAAPEPEVAPEPVAAVPQPAPPPTPADEPAATPKPFGQPDPDARARRLARALISDVAAYHPERQDVGLREGRLKELFQDELKKSWQEYVDQVGLDVARSTPYFRDALNEILAQGKKVF